ncbi:hypothetical protein [Agromyces bauzanensis]
MTSRTGNHMALTMVMLPPRCYQDVWRRPGSGSENFGSLGIARDVAQRSEAANLDAIFIGRLPHTGLDEPITTLPAQVDSTGRIGLARELASPAFVSGSVEHICDLLVPDLESRCSFRTEYEGTTLHEHLDLDLDRPSVWDAQ